MFLGISTFKKADSDWSSNNQQYFAVFITAQTSKTISCIKKNDTNKYSKPKIIKDRW
jgi:hypothetical protein